ncbi:hypothetical protein NDU88_007625 [Pleurodeles waltl]|uniref:Uncharacterized protein n=1 Tax=Pleurodeles waltl TaxID=8319 RepID=A0AAV7NWT2_PLEWA|nr:hypothetical protein NDU88_007625 [Pleurodeles waltl]
MAVSSSARFLLPEAWSPPPVDLLSACPVLRECGAVDKQADACLLLRSLISAWGLESAPPGSAFHASRAVGVRGR